MVSFQYQYNDVKNWKKSFCIAIASTCFGKILKISIEIVEIYSSENLRQLSTFTLSKLEFPNHL